jgi:hypothetical protein
MVRIGMVAAATLAAGLVVTGSALADPTPTPPCRDGLRIHARVGGHEQPTTAPNTHGVDVAGVHLHINNGTTGCQTPAPATAVPAAPAPVDGGSAPSTVLPAAPAPVIASSGPAVTH